MWRWWWVLLIFTLRLVLSSRAGLFFRAIVTGTSTTLMTLTWQTRSNLRDCAHWWQITCPATGWWTFRGRFANRIMKDFQARLDFLLLFRLISLPSSPKPVKFCFNIKLEINHPEKSNLIKIHSANSPRLTNYDTSFWRTMWKGKVFCWCWIAGITPHKVTPPFPHIPPVCHHFFVAPHANMTKLSHSLALNGEPSWTSSDIYGAGAKTGISITWL